MIICNYCQQALSSKGELGRHSSVDEERVKELGLKITYNNFDILVKCEWCNEEDLIENCVEI